MSSIVYPLRDDLEVFVKVITDKQYQVSKYLPKISKDWFDIVCDCLEYVAHTAAYEKNPNLHDCAARLLYKVAKRHELADGNKRTAVIVVYLFYVLNLESGSLDPQAMKNEARRAARSKGRENEEMIRRRIAVGLANAVIISVN